MGTIQNPFLMPWFSRADYPAVRRLLAFGARMPASYDEWLARAQAICHQVEAQHGTVERIPVTAKAFSEWCRGSFRPTNERSLHDFLHRSPPQLAKGFLLWPDETPESDELQ